MRSLTYRLLVASLAIAAAGVVASVVVSLVPLWPLSLFEHFRVRYVAVGLLVLAGCGLVQLRGWFDATAIALLAHLLWLVPDLSRSPRQVARDGPPLRVLLLNVLAMSAFLRIPIDHVLASCDIGVRARRVERDVGSDHLPVVVDLLVP